MLTSISHRLKDLTNSRRGSVMVELGLSVPLIFIFCMAAGDFARLYYHGLTAQGAASQAAFYGAQTHGQNGDFAGMEQRVTDDQGPMTASATASQWCGCPDGTEIACIDHGTTTCAGYGVPLAYVRVQVEDSFSTIGAYPRIPQNTTIRQRAWMRIR